MAAAFRKQGEGDVKVTKEDQEMINDFARQNARLEDATEDIKELEKEMRNLEDAAGEILLVAEDDIQIPYKLGDIFVSMDPEEAQQRIERIREENKARTKVLEEEARNIKGIMAELKSQLYNKFGNSINLEPDDS
ncbi:prefoldin subunit 4 [Rhipicephalus microplus]|uniref:Prefoldin subunit 4 n=1 Tax=Rhipicephalus microplus TaxID=6941 RepID=A0A6M2CKB5_RHIMP|nr:prefoldin subunit 4-like [Rhipicephalus microplus]